MNKNIAIMFAAITILLVAALFEGDGPLPALASAANSVRTNAQEQDSEPANDEASAIQSEQLVTPVVLAPGQQPPAPPSEPDPPFVQPEPLK